MQRENIPGSTIGTLISELRDEGLTLLRQEITLAKVELSEKAATASKAAVSVAIGGAVTYAGAIVLLIGAGHLLRQGLIAAGLSEATATWLGFALVGLVVAAIGWGMLTKARKHLTGSHLAPTETLGSLRDNKRWAETKIHATHEPAR